MRLAPPAPPVPPPAAPGVVPFGAPGQVPVDLGADPARDLALRELSRAVYQQARPGLLTTVVRWIIARIDDLLAAADAASPGGVWGLLVLVVLLVVVVLVVRWRFGALARTAAAPGQVLGGRERDAAEHRRLAAEHAAAHRPDDAVREWMRAIVKDLEERTVLAPRRGRTAGEAAREGGAALPAVAASLAEAARRFDETVYGGRSADATAAERMREIDREVQRARTPAPVMPVDTVGAGR